MTPYRALVLDLDGTLLVGEDVPPANADALRRAAAAGYQIVLATARWRQMAQRVALEIGIEGPVIACSGAQVHLPAEGRDIFDERMPLPFVEALYALCDGMRCVATVTVGDRVLLKLDGTPDPSLLSEEMSHVPRLTGADASLPRVAVVQGSAIYERIRAELQPRFQGEVHFFDSIGPTGKVMMTLTSAKADKGAALRVACAHLGLDPSETVALGDAENDIAMFRVAGASVAMGQASDAVKAAATSVTAPNTDSGVALAINRLLDEGRLP